MAGGIGSRFWPLSRTSCPKQFIDILGVGKTLLQQTFERMTKICPAENILIVASNSYKDLILEQLPDVKESQLLLEPMRRNTAPCIAYATYKIRKCNPEATVVVSPSDHLIMNEQAFIDSVNLALDFATKKNALLTLGVKPNRPETGYGYIQVGKPVKGISGLYRVKTFTEKPNLEMAKVFLNSGEFFWNSGLFIWNLNAIIQALEEYLPEVNSLFGEVAPLLDSADEASAIERTYAECKNISIDYGVMEKAGNVFVICSEFGWSDLGTWGSLYNHLPVNQKGNAVIARKALLYDTSNSLISAPDGKLAVVQGLDDYIVVDTSDVLLICRKQDEQQIKNMLNDVAMLKGGEIYTYQFQESRVKVKGCSHDSLLLLNPNFG
jgi:mannose-1-phosphate guanylyltransferase